MVRGPETVGPGVGSLEQSRPSDPGPHYLTGGPAGQGVDMFDVTPEVNAESQS